MAQTAVVLAKRSLLDLASAEVRIVTWLIGHSDCTDGGGAAQAHSAGLGCF